MKNKLKILIACLPMSIIFMGGCSVPGEIGGLQEFFEDGVKLVEYYEKDDDRFGERDVNTDVAVSDLESYSLEFCAYSSIGLTLRSSKSDLIITTIVFDIVTEADAELNLVLAIDGEILYESGARMYGANQYTSLVIAEIEYPESARKFEFKNVEPSDGEEEYDGYATFWKLGGLQIIYDER